MFVPARARVMRAAVLSCVFAGLFPLSVHAQSAGPAPELVITATRTALDPAHAGSAITVITSADIARSQAQSVTDLLRSVPGLDVYQTGGLGTASSVSVRGAQDGQTLVMIDGIRIGDPSATSGQTDLGQLALNDIERIEILRGPQSALYGSDAMGGVINIITKKGARKTRREVMIEGGSYGTLHTRGAISGSDGKLSYNVSIDALHSEGFPHFGYRIGRPIILPYGFALPPLPGTDPVNKGGINANFSYLVDEDTRVDVGLNANGDWLRLDNPYVSQPSSVFDPYNTSAATVIQGFGRVTHDAFDGKLRNQLTVFGNVTDRTVRERELCYDPSTFLSFDCTLGYRGTRVGAEYQGDLKLGRYGLFTFGLHNETETATTTQSPNLPGTFVATDAAQTTNAVFAQHQITLFDRLDLSIGGRVDSIVGGDTFATWRATAAYHLDADTKLRASVGTGARAPSLFQRYSQYGDPTLQPERNVGFDFGIDRKLFGGRATLSATAFLTRYRDLIGFGTVASCTPGQVALGGCYYNVSRALTKGIELSGDAILVPGEWKARAAYTFMIAEQLDPTTPLLHLPRNKAALSLIYTGVPKLDLEGRVLYVGLRHDIDFYSPVYPSPAVHLAPYTRIDLLADYKLDQHVSLFGRIENLTDVHYEEIYDYGTAGRSFYGGVKVRW